MENFSSNELEKFSKSANNWWDVDKEFKSLHDINPLRLDFIKENVNLKNKKVLDVGCGGGILTESLYLEGSKVMGIDLSEDLIKIAKKHAKSTNKDIEYKKISVEELLLYKESKKFDVITCMELIEHVPYPESIIASCSKLLKKGGLFFLSTLNKNITSYLQAIIVAEYILNLLPKKTHSYNQFITPANLYRMCLNNDLEINKFSGFSYNLLKKEYFRCSSVKVNYLCCSKKIK